MYAISQVESVRPATVRLTPATGSEPLRATNRASAGGSVSAMRASSPSAARARTSPTPSTWPCTRCPPSRSESRSERSRLTGVPARQSPSVVTRSVSGTASTAKRRGSTASAVRQQPEQSMLSPIAASSSTRAAAIQNRLPWGRSSTASTRPSSSTSPVNMSVLEIHDDARVPAQALDRDHATALRLGEQSSQPVAPRQAAAQHDRRRVQPDALHEPGAEELGAERGAALEQHLVAALAGEAPGERGERDAQARRRQAPHADAAGGQRAL